MAIIIQEEKSRFNWFVIVGVGVFFILLSASTYYLFFAETPAIDVFLSPELQRNTRISDIDLNPQAVTDLKEFKILRAYTEPLKPQSSGRSNPFLSIF
ncbi:MAG TPA: hypothetical protein VI432_02220 [Candidatus Paceibacterota bacterium]